MGGMVYSIKHDLTPNTTNLTPSIICSHANHRGDVIARSDTSGSLTSFALYEAYGTRPYEWGSDPDRQKANTKEEEKDLDLLIEGMRIRCLDTGVFLTRDPIGYKDGPNIYCYVHCNPITHFDLLGLIDAVIYDKGDLGSRFDLTTGRVRGVFNGDGATFASAAEKMGEPIPVSGLYALQQGVDAVSQKQASGETIDKVVIMDHSETIGSTTRQELGNSGINTRDNSTAELYNALGSMLKDGGYIEHLGCQSGTDENTVQHYANIAGKTVVAYTGDTKYVDDGKGGRTAKPSGMVYRTPQPLEKRQVKVTPAGSNRKAKTESRLFRGDTDVTRYVLPNEDGNEDYEENLSDMVEDYEISEEDFYEPES